MANIIKKILSRDYIVFQKSVSGFYSGIRRRASGKWELLYYCYDDAGWEELFSSIIPSDEYISDSRRCFFAEQLALWNLPKKYELEILNIYKNLKNKKNEKVEKIEIRKKNINKLLGRKNV